MCSYATTSLLSARKEVMYSNIEKNSINLFGEQIVNGKIDQMFNGELRTYTYGQTPPIESKEYRDILECLQNTDYPEVYRMAYLLDARPV